jgi:hypothetical protein
MFIIEDAGASTHTSLSPIRLWKLQKGCTRLAAASEKVYQLLAHGQWFSQGTPASSTTTTGLHDIAEILLKVALKHQKSINHVGLYLLITYLLQFTVPPLKLNKLTTKKIQHTDT